MASIRRRTLPSGKTAWQCDYIDNAGKRRHKQFRTRKEADSFLLKARSEVAAGIHTADSVTITLAEAGRLWLASGDAAGLERTTMDQRRQHVELHIVPLAGDIKLSRITVPWLRAFQETLRERGRSPAMVKRLTVSLGSILADAQARGLVAHNPVRELSRARSSANVEKRAKAKIQVGVDIPHNFEVKAIIEAASGRYRPLLITMIFTGLRASEVRGLQWGDVDLKKGVVHVRRRADRYGQLGMPKSHSGQRAIPLPPIAVSSLREWKLRCPISAEGLAFPNTQGGVEDHQNMLKRGFWPAQIAAGITVDTGKRDDDGKPILAPKYTGFHALRHWYASWCINRKDEGGLGLTAKQVQVRMGHSSIQITYDTYGHLFPSTDEGAELAAAEEALFAISAT